MKKKNKYALPVAILLATVLCIISSIILAEPTGNDGTPTTPPETFAVQTFSYQLTSTAEFYVTPTVTNTFTQTPTVTLTPSPTFTETLTPSITPSPTRTPFEGGKTGD